jgi:hypothetical protein
LADRDRLLHRSERFGDRASFFFWSFLRNENLNFARFATRGGSPSQLLLSLGPLLLRATEKLLHLIAKRVGLLTGGRGLWGGRGRRRPLGLRPSLLRRLRLVSRRRLLLRIADLVDDPHHQEQQTDDRANDFF